MKTVLCVAALLAAAISPSAAPAAAPGYCHHYADLAVWQFHRNMSIPGCFKGADMRWNGNWTQHYQWCLGAAYGEARSEDAYRGTRLHQCNMGAYGHA
jgi:hypothetical protein